MATVMAPEDLQAACMDALRKEIEGLGIQGIRSVYTENLLDSSQAPPTFPNVSISAGGETEEEGEASTFETVDMRLPCRVVVQDPASDTDQKVAKTLLRWRNKIANHFRKISGLDSVPEIWEFEVRNLVIMTERGLFHVESGMLVVCWVTMQRGDIQ